MTIVLIALFISSHHQASAADFLFSEKIHNPDEGHPTGELGRSISVDGDTMIAGAPFTDPNGLTDAGVARVYRADGLGGWTLEAELTASDAAGGDRFGWSVSVSGDTAVVGADGDDDGGSESGSVYVFTRTGDVWTQQAKLTAGDAAANDRFGSSVSVDGDTAVVGAHRDDDDGTNSGSAYVFTRTGGVWTEQAKLTALDAGLYDYFGNSVSVSGDTAVVGALGDNAGSAYVFTRTGGVWTEQAKLTASDAASHDRFGWSVSVSGDTAVVGALGDDDGGVDSGSAYVFTRSGGGWTEQAKLMALDAASYDQFGESVSVSGDTALVGALRDDDGGSSSGSAYVFTRSGSSWTQQGKLTAPDAAADDRFGNAVSIDGGTILAGAYTDDDPEDDSGSVYVFELVESPQYTLTYTAGANGSISGTSPQTVEEGTDGTAVEAVPDANYHFVQWSDGSTDNPRTDSGVTADITVEAQFAIDTHQVDFYTDGTPGA